jgi:glycosyltransferase involved in cell wall biosynthesis
MGLESLIAAMRPVVERDLRVRLFIGGKGELREPLENQVRSLGLEGNVRFVGFIPEARLPDYYAAADLFVLPTRCLEGFGLVTIEAMACGTPVMGTPIGGTQEILRGLDPRYLFRSAESSDMAAGILQGLPDLNEAEETRARCRQYALDNYSWDVLIPRIEEAFYLTVGRNSKTPKKTAGVAA